MKWRNVRLEELLRPVERPESVDPSRLYHLLGVRWYGGGLFKKEIKMGQEIQAQRLFRVHVGDFVYNRLFAWKGSFAVADEEADGCYVSNEFPCFIVNEKQADVRFLRWWFHQESAWTRALGLSQGATPTSRNRLKEEYFLAMEIPLPPLTEQQAIVARLDAIASKVHQVNTNLDSIEASAEQLLAIKFQKCIEGAPFRVIEDVAPLIRRKILIDLDASYTELGVRSFFKGTFQRRTVTGSEFTWQEIYRVKQGDLIFSNIMAWEQAIALAKVQDDGCIGNHRMLTCEVNENIAIPDFLWYYFTTPEGFAKIYAASPGTAARNRTMTSSALMRIEVPVPSLEYQRTFADLHSRITALKAHHASIRDSSQAIIPATLERLFSKA